MQGNKMQFYENQTLIIKINYEENANYKLPLQIERQKITIGGN